MSDVGDAGKQTSVFGVHSRRGKWHRGVWREMAASYVMVGGHAWQKAEAIILETSPTTGVYVRRASIATLLCASHQRQASVDAVGVISW